MSYTVIYNDKYNYFLRNNNHPPGVCHLIIYTDDTTMLCVATEIKDNTSMSVTNAAESIASQVFDQFDMFSNPIRNKKFIWVEHYPERGTQLHPIKETYDLVNFNWDNGKAYHATWKHIGNKTDFDTFLNSVFSEKKTIKISEFRKKFFAVTDSDQAEIKELLENQDGIKEMLEKHFDKILEEMKNER